jgi:serine/threonine protein phosphatase PrpC
MQEVPGLAMTRSFGDQVASTVGVTARPDVLEYNCDDSDCFFIIATDGIWEFITNEQAVEIVSHAANPEQACAALVQEAVSRWQREEEVIDDITAIVVFLVGWDGPSSLYSSASSSSSTSTSSSSAAAPSPSQPPSSPVRSNSFSGIASGLQKYFPSLQRKK